MNETFGQRFTEEVIKLVDAGLVGELVTVESAEGDHIKITV